MLDVNVSWPLQGKLWETIPPSPPLTSCAPTHPFSHTLSSLTLRSSLGLAFVNSSLAFQPRSAVTLYLSRTDSQREKRKPLSSLIPLISQPTISSPEWALFTCCFSILSLFHHYIPFSSLCSLTFCFSCPVICLSVFQSNRCVKWLSTLVLFGELIIAVPPPPRDSLT